MELSSEKTTCIHAGMIERGVQPVDIAGELIMVKAEIDFTVQAFREMGQAQTRKKYNVHIRKAV